MRRLLLAGAAFVLAAGLGGAWLGWREYRAPGPLDVARAVLVPRGGAARLGAVLSREGVVRQGWMFEAAAGLTAKHGTLRTGELEFPAHASLEQVLAVLRLGHRVEHRITFAEGLTAAQIARVAASDAALDGEVAVPEEGAVLPETYAFERPAAAGAVLKRAAEAGEAALAGAWRDRAPGLALQTPRQALILASIVERETHLADERPMVAAVFLNRLRAGMKLQADPTAAYGAAGGLVLDRALAHADLERDDTYNSYVREGLPAGPICSPGRATLAAVLHPAVTDALYFVADGSGGHRFAATLAEHNRNVAALRALAR